MPYKGSGKLPGNQSGKNKPLADQLTGDKLAQGKGHRAKLLHSTGAGGLGGQPFDAIVKHFT